MDPNRTLVDKLVLHHAVTPLWDEKSKAELAQWFSDNGFARAYGSNPANWSGLVNPYTGGRSYSQAHLAGQRVTERTPDATPAERAAGYRLVPLVANIWNVITWHAGNWPVNCGSIGIENLGDYRNYSLREGDCKVIADFWRPRDRELGGATMVYGHREVSQVSTECPAHILDSRDHIIDLINAEPTPPPAPVPQQNITSYQRIEQKRYEIVRDTNLWNFNADTQAAMVAVKPFKAGDQVDIAGKALYKTGSVYMMTPYSFGEADKTGKPTATNGFNAADLREITTRIATDVLSLSVPFETTTIEDSTLPKGETKITREGVNGKRTITYRVTYVDEKETGRTIISDVVTQEPVSKIVVVGTKEASTPKDDEQDGRIGRLEAIVQKIVDFLKSIFTGFKG